MLDYQNTKEFIVSNNIENDKSEIMKIIDFNLQKEATYFMNNNKL